MSAAVLIRRAILDQIVAGSVDLQYRRWERPRVRVGTRLHTAVGMVAIDAIEPVDPESVSDDDVRRAGARSREKLLAGDPARPLYRIELRYDGPDPRIALREDDRLDAGQLAVLETRLARLDSHGPSGPWTRALLELIARHPATRAADLAATLDRDTPSFKRDVRKLKGLGLTESLGTGYRLSPRGRALLDRSPARHDQSTA